MGSALHSEAVRGVLQRLAVEAEEHDAAVKERLLQTAKAGEPLPFVERSELCAEAPIAVSAEVGELLYVLAMSRRAGGIVEFGASLGVSTIYLAAALRDTGDGSLITTELHPEKARRAVGNLAEAGLAELVEMRVGDALETLADLEGDVDLLVLDGWNELYMPLLRLVEPRLVSGAVVVADLNKDDPALEPFLAYVRDERNGYTSTTLPLDAGVEVSVRVPE